MFDARSSIGNHGTHGEFRRGRTMYVAGALQYERLFLGPQLAFLTQHTRTAVRRAPPHVAFGSSTFQTTTLAAQFWESRWLHLGSIKKAGSVRGWEVATFIRVQMGVLTSSSLHGTRCRTPKMRGFGYMRKATSLLSSFKVSRRSLAPAPSVQLERSPLGSSRGWWFHRHGRCLGSRHHGKALVACS